MLHFITLAIHYDRVNTPVFAEFCCRFAKVSPCFILTDSQRKVKPSCIARKLYIQTLEKLQSWRGKHTEMRNFKGAMNI